MSSTKTKMGLGFTGPQAEAEVGNIEVGVTATGSTNADAYVITADATLFTTVASGTGAILPDVGKGSEIRVYNGGANALLLYPPASGQLNNKTATTGTISIAANKGAKAARLSAVHWGVISD